MQKRQHADELDASCGETDLDDAATMQAEAQQQALLDLEEVVQLDNVFYTRGSDALKVLLHLPKASMHVSMTTTLPFGVPMCSRC